MIYTDHFLILVFAITVCVSFTVIASLVGIPVVITISPLRLKIYSITAGIKKYKSVTKKKKKNHHKTVLLAKPKLNSIELLVSKALTNSYISHDDFF